MPLLGNVVISKKILRTRKIMVMHSNERGECCLRTLVDLSGSVDATRGGSRTSSRSNRSKQRYSGTSEFLAHVQLDDAPRAPIQQSFGEEFHQHDGVVTILMFKCRRASPKHCYNMIEV